MIENYCKHFYIDEFSENICFIHCPKAHPIQNLPDSYLQNLMKNIYGVGELELSIRKITKRLIVYGVIYNTSS